MRIGLYILLSLIISVNVFGQSDPIISHNRQVPSVFNPAMSNPEGKLNVSALTRRQWVGMSNAPVNYLFNGQYKVNNKLGVGLLVINDKIGFENTIIAGLSASYAFRLSDATKLSFGLRGGVMNKSLDGTQLIYEEHYDANGLYHLESEFVPDLSPGMNLKAGNFSLGAAVSHLLQDVGNATIFKPSRHIYAYTSYVIKSGEFDFIPTVFFKKNAFVQQYEMSVDVAWDESLFGSITYRSKGIYSFRFGLMLTEKIFAGYAYDMDTQNIRTESGGSHEILIQYKIPEIIPKPVILKSTRFF